MPMQWVLSLLLFFVASSAVPAEVKGETSEPTREGERIRRETLARGLSYIAFTGTDHLEIAQGKVEIGPGTLRFRNRLGQLFSVRLDLVDIPTTERIRELIGQARWLDKETAVMARVRVQPPSLEAIDERAEEPNLDKRSAKRRADCMGPTGSTLGECSPASHGQSWRTPKARPRPRRARPARTDL
ncbi:MAG: hypothetical protein ABI609_13350 [Acidobacteriota bacterium]